MREAAASVQSWWIQVRDSAYGPYTEAQMRQFIGEGRVKGHSLISQDRSGGWKSMRETAQFADAFGASFSAPKTPVSAAPDAANLFIFAEIQSGAWTQFMAALETMGRIAELAPGFWLLRSKFSSGVVRNTLSQTLETGDRFVVVDATRDRLAWYNMGPGIDVSIRDTWNAGL